MPARLKHSLEHGESKKFASEGFHRRDRLSSWPSDGASDLVDSRVGGVRHCLRLGRGDVNLGRQFILLVQLLVLGLGRLGGGKRAP